jgi:hypothetical protein
MLTCLFVLAPVNFLASQVVLRTSFCHPLLCDLCGREVKQMVELVQAAGGKDSQSQAKLCGRSSFHAAGDRATPTPGRLLNGRFILGCSHLLILRAANMPAEFGGERYAYPMLMAAGACRS